MSGGIDSSYLTYLAKEKMGLRPLVFHVDASWNSQIAVNNIERLIDGLGLDLYWGDWLAEMRDLTSVFHSGVSILILRRITPFLPRCTSLLPSTRSNIFSPGLIFRPNASAILLSGCTTSQIRVSCATFIVGLAQFRSRLFRWHRSYGTKYGFLISKGLKLYDH